MTTGRSSPEYQTILAHTNDLRLAAKCDLLILGGQLLAKGLISPDNEDSLRNMLIGDSERAANCVRLITTKVEEDPQNYHTFVRVLKMDSPQYQSILTKLQKTYTELQPRPQPPSDTQAAPSCFNCSMSEEDFLKFLNNEGLSNKDCEMLKKNGITARGFSGYFEAEVDNPELGFTYGGKKVLKKVLQDLRTSAESGKSVPLGSFIEEVDAKETMDREEPRWEELPVEVWQLVFQRVPLLDLITSGKSVCQQWNRIISDESFLHWRKLYFRLKYRDPHTFSKITTMLHPLSADGRNFTLIHLARLFGDTFSHLGVDLEAVLSVMSIHPQYSCVAQIRKQLASDGPELGVLESLLLLVTCCTSVHQVLHLITLLSSPITGGLSSPALGYKEMSELFHAMATFFLFLSISGSLPPRFHYNVFYSLDVVHRSSFVPPFCHHLSSPLNVSISSSQTDYPASYSTAYSELKDDIIMTSEQARVVAHPIKRGETLKVVAFAGTGKTTTLVQFAKSLRNQHRSIGYCVYNKSVQVNASKHVFKDCHNVKCKTFHSIAYYHVGCHYRKDKKHPGGKGISELSTYYVAKYVTNPPNLDSLNTEQSLYTFAKYVKGTLENFMSGTDREIKSEHIPRFQHSDSVRVITAILENSEEVLADNGYVTRILEETTKVWNKMKNVDDKSVCMTHDGYLKLFQLSPVDFAKEMNWDILLIDEAQDLTPATIDLIMKTSCAKIFVGDPHQQIYSFRGATNAMPLVTANHTFYLTRSFRFGPEIAYVSAMLLKTLKGVRQQTLVGSADEGCVFGTRSFSQVTIIARTNLGLFEEMIRVLKTPGGDKKKLGFVGGIDSYEFNSLEAIYFLLQGNHYEAKSRHYIGNRFKTFNELQQYAEHSSDVQLQLKAKVCLNHSTDLLEIITQLKTQNVDALSFADVIFTTAHKSKGLQFDNVMLVDDFLSNFDPSVPLDSLRLHDDERNLLYVAASRAKCQLTLSPTCVNVLKKSGEHFVYPTTSQGSPSEAATSCIVCGILFSDSCPLPRLKLHRPALKLSTSSPKIEGLVCRSCGCHTLRSFSFSF